MDFATFSRFRDENVKVDENGLPHPREPGNMGHMPVQGQSTRERDLPSRLPGGRTDAATDHGRATVKMGFFAPFSWFRDQKRQSPRKRTSRHFRGSVTENGLPDPQRPLAEANAPFYPGLHRIKVVRPGSEKCALSRTEIPRTPGRGKVPKVY